MSEIPPYTYELPRERIAQRPVEPRDSAGMLVVDRRTGAIFRSAFVHFPAYVRQGDLLVVNNTVVRPARLFGELTDGRGECELLLLTSALPEDTQQIASACSPEGGSEWWCIGRPMRRFVPGTQLTFSRSLTATILDRRDHQVRVRFESERPDAPVSDLVREAGTMPIPPYIREGRGDEQDRGDYQSIFARCDSNSLESSIAAPTASLHFTAGLLSEIRAAGCEIATVTLHVGLPSIRPLFRNEEGEMIHEQGPGIERYHYDGALVNALRETRLRGGRIIAVGTTVVRALESMMRADPSAALPSLRETDLFISPGFSFQAIDAMVTNFHQPGSSHLLLVESLLGRELLARSYEEALGSDMRFLSYGDGMLIL